MDKGLTRFRLARTLEALDLMIDEVEEALDAGKLAEDDPLIDGLYDCHEYLLDELESTPTRFDPSKRIWSDGHVADTAKGKRRKRRTRA